MGAAVSSTIGLGITYCTCNALGAVCNSCLGSTAEGTTGRKRSVLLLTLAIIAAFWFQYKLGPAIVSQSGWIWKSYRLIPGIGKFVYTGWHDPCEKYSDNMELMERCAGNAGVYRPMLLSTIFFACHAVATHVLPLLQREVWPAKYTLYFVALIFSVFVPTDPLFGEFFLFVARVGGTIFVILQQLILIDVAYNWNEEWVERANEADRSVYGEGAQWLQAILATCISFYGLTLFWIVHLFNTFGGCSGNVWVITLTLIAVVAMTGIQMSGREGSLLTSSVMSLYITYLAFLTVSKNPIGSCNPRLGQDDWWGITVGLFLTAVSLAWTGWSWTAQERLTLENAQSARTAASPRTDPGMNLDVPFINPEDQSPTGIVTTQSSQPGGELQGIWKLNVVMALISCWVAMTLTGWGIVTELDENLNAANPTVSRVNMAMMGISQWMAVGLYVWTLVAPRLFPDRDFS